MSVDDKSHKPKIKAGGKAIVKVEKAKEPLVKVVVKSRSGNIVVADSTKGRIAIKNAMVGYKKERRARKPGLPGTLHDTAS